MSLLQKLRYLLPSCRREQEREMQEELESLSALAGTAELGNLTLAAEQARAAWGWTWAEQCLRDVHYALRTMRHNLGFTTTVVLSLALGIGANTAIFSLFDALTLRWLPVRNPQELVQLKLRSARSAAFAGDTFSNAIVEGLAGQKDIFSNVCGFSASTFDVGSRGSIRRVPAAWVTGEYYQTLGLTPVLGRLLEPGDDEAGAPPEAVISYGFWQRRFAASLDVIGQSVEVNHVPVRIVGVSGRGFEGANVGTVADITMATAALPQIEPSSAGLLQPGNFWLRILARPANGISVSQARVHLAVLWPQIASRVLNPKWPEWQRKEMAQSVFDLAPGGTGYSNLRVRFEQPLITLMALTALVLLLACANVASLLLARATARQREIAVRLAIGAGRGRIIRQLLTESVALSALGTAVGVCFAWITSRFLVDLLSGGGSTALVFDLTPNWHVLAFASAVAVATGILFGLAPALQTTAAGSRAIGEGTRVTRSRSRLLSSLVAGQAALALLLLVAAGLFARTLQNLENVDPGFRREGVLLVDLDGQREGYQGSRLAEVYRSVLDRARQTPGVVSASLSTHTPLSGWTWSEAVVPKGEPLPQRDNATLVAAGPGFFATMQTPFVAGRDFDDGDHGAPSVAIVNQTFAARHFPNQNPVGRYLTATVTRPPSDLRIVGVVKDVATRGLREPAPPIVYVSYFQHAPGTDTLVLRVRGSLARAASAIREQIQPSFPNTAIEVRGLNQQVERTLVRERLMTTLSSGFGVLGLVLACVGLYGLLGYSVARRTKEIGLRVALGAPQRAVRWMIVRRALLLLTAGVMLGVPAAWLVSRWLESMLFGVTPMDPRVLAGAAGVLTAAGLLAAYFPARRATRVDPIRALRHE